MTSLPSPSASFAFAALTVLCAFTSWMFAPPRLVHAPAPGSGFDAGAQTDPRSVEGAPSDPGSSSSSSTTSSSTSSSSSAGLGQAPRAAQDFSKLFVDIAKRTRPALVFIETKGNMNLAESLPGLPPFGDPEAPFDAIGAGSGFLIDVEKGYVVTNSHVVSTSKDIEVTTYDNRKFKGVVVGSDENVDVAVVRLQKFSRGALKHVSFGNSDAMEVGDWVVALGAPFGLPQTVTHGLISALGRGDLIGGQAFEDFIQTDAPINPGNSGGPLLNLQGEVIGVNTAISSPNGTSAGIGFAVPSHMVQVATQMLIRDGRVTRGYLGMQGQDVSDLNEDVLRQKKLSLEEQGAYVVAVQPGGPADRAGLVADDVIVSLNGRPVPSFTQLRTRVAFMPPGTIARLSVKRQGRVRELSLEVGRFPAETETALRDPEGAGGAGGGDGEDGEDGGEGGFTR